MTLAKAGRCGLLAAAITIAAVGFGSLHPAHAEAARGLDLGFVDSDLHDGSPSVQTEAFNRVVQAGAGWVLIYVDWSRTAPQSPPPGFNAANPADPAYDWISTDAAVKNAASRGLHVLLAFTIAPPWAEGPNRPSLDKAPEGTWQPNPADVGNFARAIATRYSGNFMGLPAVRYWQLWAEPNLAVNLGPQFIGNTPVGFDIYRPMLNAFYRNVKAVSSQNFVVTGGTAPYGNLTPASGLVFQRMQPLAFWRGLLCYSAGTRHKKKKGKKAVASRSAGRLIPQPCPDPAHFDIAAHHPINVGAPTRAAINPDDVSTPDLRKLYRVLRVAAASGRVIPGGAKPLWATEIWWNSRPPAPRGISLARQARYLEQGFYVLWKQAVQAVFWFEIKDLVSTGGQQAGGLPIPTSGVFFSNGTPKPSLQAFQFPFVTERLGAKRVRAWGEAPHGGPVSIEVCRHRCHPVKTLSAGDNRVFVGILHLGGKARLRATQGSESSLIWRQN